MKLTNDTGKHLTFYYTTLANENFTQFFPNIYYEADTETGKIIILLNNKKEYESSILTNDDLLLRYIGNEYILSGNNDINYPNLIQKTDTKMVFFIFILTILILILILNKIL